MTIKDLLKHIVQAMVDDPEQIEISEIETDQSTILELKVAKSDMGKVIGKKGKNVNAIRTILSGVAAKERKHIILEILD